MKSRLEKDIITMFSKSKCPLYYSDIAAALDVDIKKVVKICTDLIRKGVIK